jgi:hypothetical protein
VPIFLILNVLGANLAFAQNYESINIGQVLDAGPAGITLPDGTIVRAKVVSSGNGDATDPAIGNNTGQIGGTFNGNTIPAYAGLTTPTLFTALVNDKVNLRNGGATNYAHAVGFRVYFSRPYKLKQILVLDIDGLVGAGNNSEWTSSFAYNGNTRINPTAFRHTTTQIGFDVPGTVAPGWNNLVDAELGAAAEDFNGTTANPVVAFRNVDGTGNDVDPDDLPNQVLYDFGNQQATDFFVLWGILPNTSNVAPPNNRQSSGVSPLVVSPISLSGTVFNDVNGLNGSPVNTVDGVVAQSASGTQLHANLFSESGDFITTMPLDASGSYSFTNISPSTNYQVTISSTPASAGSTPAGSVGLVPGWVNTGETNNGLGTLSDGTVNGITLVAVGTDDVASINFGIEQTPETAVNSQPIQANPGGTTNVTVPADAFVTSNVGSNPNTGDPAPGAVTGIVITEFPTNATSITIDGTLYTTLGLITAAYPNGIPTDPSGQPTLSIEVDPQDGIAQVVLPIAAVDAAGQQDPTPGSITIPFQAVYSIAGNVFNDANGVSAPENTVNGTPVNGADIDPAMAGQQPIFASLIQDGSVLATVPILPSGSYLFEGVLSGSYSVVITTNAAGSTSPGLPAGWGYTGEHIGTDPGSDGTTNGTLLVTVTNQDVAQANFGINLAPVGTPVDEQITQPAPGQVLTLDGSAGNPPAPAGTDSEEGPLSNHVFTVTSLPPFGILSYNGSPVQENVPIPGFLPSLLTIELTGTGYDSTFFEYTFTDGAGVISTPTLYRLVWPAPLPVKLMSFDIQNESGVAVLSWKTASEMNSDQFIIQHSSDGKLWADIESMQAKGESTVNVQYQYVHVNPSAGQNLYRLKMLDKDGTFAYSQIRAIKIEGGNSVSVFPNPTTGTLNISEAAQVKIAKLEIFNTTGQLVAAKTEAKNNVMNLSGLPSGTYILVIQFISGEKATRKVILAK